MSTSCLMEKRFNLNISIVYYSRHLATAKEMNQIVERPITLYSYTSQLFDVLAVRHLGSQGSFVHSYKDLIGTAVSFRWRLQFTSFAKFCSHQLKFLYTRTRRLTVVVRVGGALEQWPVKVQQLTFAASNHTEDDNHLSRCTAATSRKQRC